MKQDFENDIREHLAQYEEQVPEGLWAGIEQRVVDAEQKGRQEKARVVILRRWVAGVAASVTLLLGGWYAVDRMGDTLSDKMTAVVKEEAEMLEAEAMENDVVEHETIEKEKPSNRQSKHFSPTNALLVTPITAEETGKTESPEIPEKPESPEIPESPEKPENPESPDNPENPEKPGKPDNPDNLELPKTPKLPTPPSTPSSRKLAFSARATNLLTANTMGISNVEPMLMNMRHVGSVFDYMSNGARRAPMYLANYEEEADHHLPLTIGLSARLSLTRHLWLESGLSYSYVASTFTHHLNTVTTTDEQRLHYIGVPLNVGYSFWQKPRLRTYASGGTQADFCVKSALQTHGGEGTLERDRVQFSFTLSVGVEYELLPQVGVYLQPGITYYPDNGSRLQNIFKEKPTQPSLQFGLRYSLR